MGNGEPGLTAGLVAALLFVIAMIAVLELLGVKF